jgi:hypothetical protein
VIRLACPSCSKKLAVEDGSAGTVCKCPACNNKFRVPAAPAAAVARQAQPASTRIPDKRPGGGSSPSARDSGRNSGARAGKSSKPASVNGRAVDELEVVDEPQEVQPRQKSRKNGRGQTPRWVNVTAAVAGGVLFVLAIAAFFFQYVWIGLTVIGLPASLLGRKWRMLGLVGVAYLLTGASFLLMHKYVLKPVEGPPPPGASAQAVDRHCVNLLKDRDKVEAGSWVSVEKPNEPSLIRGLRVLIKDAYSAGATQVWLTNPDKKDPAGLPAPDMVVVLPDDDTARARVIAWYKRATVGKHAPTPGDQYVYVPWD